MPPSSAPWPAGLLEQKGKPQKGLPGSRSGLDLFNFGRTRASLNLGAASKSSRSAARTGKQVDIMDETVKQKQQGDILSWIVIGLIHAAVTAALFGPLIWERIHLF
jgi:hypothetical protein